MAKISLDENNLVRSICKASFFEFVKEFWDVIIAEEPVFNWHIKYLCDELQKMAHDVHAGKVREYDLLVNISPGTTKSTIFSRMFPAWVWTFFPEARFICASFTQPLSLAFSVHSRDIVQSDKYRAAFPEVILRQDQNTKGGFQNTKGGERRAYSVGGQIMGFHAHFIVIDDPIDPEATTSDADMKKVNRWLKETIPTRKVDKAVVPIIMIMQRLHQNDPSANFLEQGEKRGKLKHICLPATSDGNVKPDYLRDFYQDGLMDPVRLSQEVLDDFKITLGNYGYACQFDQDPVPREGGMFKPERIEIDEPFRKFKRKVRYWDKAGTLNGGCFTAGVLIGIDVKDRFWILDVVKGQWSAEQRERVIKSTAQLDGYGVIIGIEQEGGSGGKESAQNTVKNLAGFKVRVDRPVGDKALRADPFSVQVDGGNVSMKKAPWNAEYIEEMRHFPNSKYKDQIDASSGAFALLTKKRKRAGAV